MCNRESMTRVYSDLSLIYMLTVRQPVLLYMFFDKLKSTTRLIVNKLRKDRSKHSKFVFFDRLMKMKSKTITIWNKLKIVLEIKKTTLKNKSFFLSLAYSDSY